MSQKDILFPQLQETITCTCLTYMLFNNFRPYYYIDQYDNIRLGGDYDNDNNISNDSNDVKSRVSYKGQYVSIQRHCLNLC